MGTHKIRVRGDANMANALAIALEELLRIRKFRTSMEAKVDVGLVNDYMSERAFHTAGKGVVERDGVLDIVHKFDSAASFFKD